MAELCRRCGAEIATANLMDIDPGVDRAHFALVLAHSQRRQLSPTLWRLFAALYQRHGRIVPTSELARAARVPLHALREEIRRLRSRLFGSRFQVVTHPSYGLWFGKKHPVCRHIKHVDVGAVAICVGICLAQSPIERGYWIRPRGQPARWRACASASAIRRLCAW
jgi:hypothetical protein